MALFPYQFLYNYISPSSFIRDFFFLFLIDDSYRIFGKLTSIETVKPSIYSLSSKP